MTPGNRIEFAVALIWFALTVKAAWDRNLPLLVASSAACAAHIRLGMRW